MDHQVTIINLERFSGLLDEQTIRDFIDMFYRWEPAKFNVVLLSNVQEMRKRYGDPKISKTIRGEHRYNTLSRAHTITLVRENIEDAFKNQRASGGNIPPPTLQAAAVMVLSHELQHANQIKNHQPTADSTFWNERGYKNRACERDARSFVDEHLHEIFAYLQLPPPRPYKKVPLGNPNQELQAVADLLVECSEVSMEDIKEELRASRILNPKNMASVIDLLKNQGVQVRN